VNLEFLSGQRKKYVIHIKLTTIFKISITNQLLIFLYLPMHYKINAGKPELKRPFRSF